MTTQAQSRGRSRLYAMQRFIVPEWTRAGIRRIQHHFEEPKKFAYYASISATGLRVLHFLHIQKTGGTAVAAALEGRQPLGPYHVEYRGHGSGMRRVPLGDGVIFFLRDPLSRFISGFRDRQAQGQPRYDSPWSFGEYLAFRRFKTPDQLARSLSSPQKQERAAAEAAFRSIRHVNATLDRWLVSPDYLESRKSDVFFVGFQETLETDYARLHDLLKLPQDARLPTDPVRAHRRQHAPKDVLSGEAVDNLRRWYADDYRFIAQASRMGLAPRDRLPW